jgi:choice-of-anchor C domain-containing protein
MGKASLISALAIVAALTLPAHANLIVNGDFSSPCGGPYLGFCTPNVGPAGWTMPYGDVDVVNTMWQELPGMQSVDLNGDTTGSIAQTFETIVGVPYRVSFDMGGNPFGDNQGADAIKTMNVLVTGNATRLYSGSYSYDTSGIPLVFGTYIPWVAYTFTFTATGSSTTLEFDSTTIGPINCCWGAAITNVDVISLPEPGCLTLIGPALLGGLALRKLRIRR